MKKILLAACLCFITSNSMGLSLFPKCQITCGASLAQKALPNILKAGGDPSGDATFLDCAKSCRFSTTKNMWYALLANAIYQTARVDLEKTAGIDSTLSRLGGDNFANGLTFNKFAENFAIELLTKVPAYGMVIEGNRESSFMGGEFLPNVDPDQFEKSVRNQTPIKQYLISTPRHKEAGERLVKAVMEKFRGLLSRFESDTDKRFGQNITVSKKDILKDFQRQTAEENKLGTPKASKGAWYSVLPIRSCARNCSTFRQGKNAGASFTKDVVHDGKLPEKTLLYWCQKNCEPKDYGIFFCGAYDNIARAKEDFGKNNEQALSKLNPAKNRIYATSRKQIEKCLNLFNNYGTAARANDVGTAYKFNMTMLIRQAHAFNKAKIAKIKVDKKQPLVEISDDLDDKGGADITDQELDRLLAEYDQ